MAEEKNNTPAGEETKITSSTPDNNGMINVTLEPDEPTENNPSLKDLVNKSEHISRMTDKGLINEKAGASVSIRDNGQINLSASTYAQYKISPTGKTVEHSYESITTTNRKRLNTDEIVINDHKLNPKIWELTDFKKLTLPNNTDALVGNFCIAGSVLVKAWEVNLKRYVMIRRPARMPLFSPLLNLPKIMPELGITDPLEFDEDILAKSDDGYQVNGVISDAKSLVGKAGVDRDGIDRNFQMTIGSDPGSTSTAPNVNSGSLGGGNVEPSLVYKYLKGKGYNEIAAAGIMGNIQQESSFSTSDPNAESGAYGLCQWLGGRLDGLKSLAASTNRKVDDAGTQLDFLWMELQGYEALVPGALNNVGTSEEVAEIFEKKFERSGGSAMENRKSYAKQFYDKIKSGEIK